MKIFNIPICTFIEKAKQCSQILITTYIRSYYNVQIIDSCSLLMLKAINYETTFSTIHIISQYMSFGNFLILGFYLWCLTLPNGVSPGFRHQYPMASTRVVFSYAGSWSRTREGLKFKCNVRSVNLGYFAIVVFA